MVTLVDFGCFSSLPRWLAPTCSRLSLTPNRRIAFIKVRRTGLRSLLCIGSCSPFDTVWGLYIIVHHRTSMASHGRLTFSHNRKGRGCSWLCCGEAWGHVGMQLSEQSLKTETKNESANQYHVGPLLLARLILHATCVEGIDTPPCPSFTLAGSSLTRTTASMGRCLNHVCTARARYNIQGIKTALYCRKHAEDGMLNVYVRRCLHYACTKSASFNFHGKKFPTHCLQHAMEGMVNVRNRRHCSHSGCSTVPSFNVEGRKTPLYCKKHARDGMVNVCHKQCAHDSCTTTPFFNVEGSKQGKYCKQHAEDGMIDIYSNRCSEATCNRGPYFNSKGSKTAAYCRQHAQEDMVDVRSRQCLHHACATFPSFNVEGSKTPAYCKRHAGVGMVDVRSKQCLHDSCVTFPSFNVEGSKAPAYCKRHAGVGMVYVHTRRCSNDGCARLALWGVLSGRTGTACADHKGNILDGPVVNFRASCQVAGCRISSTWGLNGEQPSHCYKHGPLGYRLRRTVGTNGRENVPRNQSPRDERGASLQPKAECFF